LFKKLLPAVIVAASLLATFVSPAMAASVGPVQSCADVHASSPSAPDGDYTIYPNHQQIPVYCKDMATAPKEYLTLAKTGSFPATAPFGSNSNPGVTVNYSSWQHNGPINWDVTLYSKVRLNPATLKVDTSDPTFSQVHTYQPSAAVHAAWATNESCGFDEGLGANGFSSNSNVDLTGTPFAVNDTFVDRGCCGNFSQATFSTNNQVVVLSSRGNCGGLSASGDPFLQLKYIGPLDTTPPTITASATTTDNQAYNGAWTNQNVTVAFTCNDSGFGVASCPSPVTVSTEGANQSVSGTATDNAGNTAPATFSNINVDKTAPTVTYSGNAGSYTVDQTVNITCSASDSLSGVASTMSCTNVAAPAYSFVLGGNTLSATATDKAGNVGHGSTTFTVVSNANTLSNLISQLVSNSGVAQSLQTQVNSIASAPNANAKAGKLGAFSHFLSAQTGKSLSAQQASLLLKLASAL
jgi:hypothetical protein